MNSDIHRKALDVQLMRSKATRGVFWSALESWGMQVANFTLIVVLARFFLTPAEFGVVALAQVVILFFQYFVSQGLSDAIVQREELRKDHLDTAFWFNLGLGVSMCVAVFFGAPSVGRIFGADVLSPIIQVLSLTFVINALGVVQEGQFRRAMDFRVLAFRQFFGTGLGVVLGLIAAYAGAGVWSLVVYQVVQHSGKVVLLWWSSDWRPGLLFTRLALRELLGFSVSILGINLVVFFNRRMDILLIGRFIGATALGYYSIANKVMQVMVLMFSTVVVKVAFPAFSQLRSDPQKMLEAFYFVTSATTALAFPAFAFAALASPEIVPLVFGDAWMGAISLMAIISWLGFLQSIQTFNMVVLRAWGKPHWSLWYYAFLASINLVGFWLFWEDGITVVAMIFVVNSVVLSPLTYWMLYRLMPKISWWKYFRGVWRPLLGVLAMIYLVPIGRGLADPESDLGRFLWVGSFGLSGYVGVWLLFGRGQLRATWRFFRSRFRKKRRIPPSVLLPLTPSGKLGDTENI